ncbi:GNAT family N-acetyltransferase [Limosilactobacillus sp. RRLNB_1_1]|uniref:GNAT family N-acetyltransferase n=1 Tax=Limosilactobacillus albertensis TaxID=2759752 RepID=A0A7W3TSN7_9LACO|nr:GNAT family N-acetyltransferase [Limosilactobacillus albertensis]MBB1069966.1 GNAT family N-acetyltransferase [Limosilactobacillus albertensis]MCD7117203.1 GNAT family N-acetyltransferase [Limosilactobacillus albertensis]MCD7128807.1 GNAT family N-acetyltransferase [Limosilactobacillus albertensis]
MWQTKRFNELTVTDLYQLLALRSQIFVVDQQRIYQDPDGRDQNAIHIFNRDEKGDVVAYARVFLKDNLVSFGRVATSAKVRGQGLGGQLLDKIMQTIQQKFPGKPIEIEAQVQVEDFYKRVGFVSEGEPFIYKSTPHIKMVHGAM